jgi:thiamine biosynthesis lipoprotein
MQAGAGESDADPPSVRFAPDSNGDPPARCRVPAASPAVPAGFPVVPVGPFVVPVGSLVVIARARRAMGCAVTLRVVGAEGSEPVEAALDEAIARIEQLEGRWSRFRVDSELSRLNRDGHAEGLSEDTFSLIADAIEAWRRTDARFDPTVHDALVAAGYDRTFEAVAAAAPLERAQVLAPLSPDDDAVRAPVPGPVGIALDATTRSITLPPGVHLDLGGIGKGRAADVAARLLHERTGRGVSADLGGDVRVRGTGPEGGPWGVAIEDPFDPAADLTVLALEAGAVATSARTGRAWRSRAVPADAAASAVVVAHHLIDPATGRPATSGLASVSVVAEDAQWAEVMAKAAFVAGLGPGADLIAAAGLDGILVTDERWVVRTPGFHRFEVPVSDR